MATRVPVRPAGQVVQALRDSIVRIITCFS